MPRKSALLLCSDGLM